MQILLIQFLRELVMMELEQSMAERVNLGKVLNLEEKLKNIDVLLQKKIQKIFQNLQNLSTNYVQKQFINTFAN